MGLVSILLPSEMTFPRFHLGDLGKHRRDVDAYVSLVAGQSALVNRAASCAVLFFFPNIWFLIFKLGLIMKTYINIP